jgi:transposase
MRKEPVVENTITWVGLDAHKATIQVAMLLPGRAEPVQWQVANEPRDVRRLVRKIQRAAPGAIRSCYEAGVCGYALQRQLEVAGMACEVIAPALVPVKRGDRIKTDKRDARKLATLLRAGLLTAVRPPTPAEEAARDLCRAREDAVEDLQRARHRLGKFLLRRGLVWRASTAWSQAHRRWLRDLAFERAVDRIVVSDYLLRQAKPGEGGRDAWITRLGNPLSVPAGRQSRPAKAGHQPEPSVAW